MKLSPLLFPLLSLSLSLSLPAQEKDVPPPFEEKSAPVANDEDSATDPFDPDVIDDSTPVMVQVQVEYIEMPHDKLTDLLFLKRPTRADATELRKEIQAKVKGGEATLLETQLLTGRSGEKCLVESIHEQIYPTEFIPPAPPQPDTTSDKDGSTASKPAKIPATQAAAPTPASFETRNVGSTLDIEPSVASDGKLIDLRFSPELVWHDGNTSWQERKDALGNVTKVELPDFYTVRLTTALTVTRGSYVLAGVASPRSKDGATDFSRKVMIFIKADLLPVR